MEIWYSILLLQRKNVLLLMGAQKIWPARKAMQMIENGKIKDGKTIMLLQYVKLNDLV
jgi:hypothetical protein